jgi:hypothetical protein
MQLCIFIVSKGQSTPGNNPFIHLFTLPGLPLINLRPEALPTLSSWHSPLTHADLDPVQLFVDHHLEPVQCDKA